MNTTNHSDVKGHARFSEKISFGFGSAAYACEMAVTNAYFMLFCTDVLGISAASVGILFLIGKIVDAATDIIVTNIADKTNTPWGKYRPWILMGIPLSVSFVSLYWYPAFLTTNWFKLLWVYVCYFITISGFETAITCPMQVMCTSVSQHDDDRIHFVTAKSLGEASGDLICGAMIMPIILMFGSYKDIAGWRVAVLVMGAMIAVFAIIGFVGTKERVLNSSVDENGESLHFKDKIKALNGNKPFAKMIAITMSTNVLWIFSLSLSSYYCIYVVGHEEWVSPVYTVATIAQILVTCSFPVLTRYMRKKRIVKVGAIFSVLSGLACAVAMGFWGTIFYGILRGIGVGLLMSSVWAIWPDAADYTEYTYGKAVPGIIMAFANFSTKLSIGVASYLATFCLSWFRYDAALEVQDAFFLNGLHISLVVVPIVFGILILVITMTLKELCSSNMEKIREELFARR